MHFKDGNEIFVGTNNAGIYYSNTGGTTWTAINTGLTTSFINKIIKYGTELYAATFSGVYRSSNNGLSWSQSNSGLSSTVVHSVVAF
ncbi:MAG: hypothetical protein IPK10_04045 [Bacteroidetes bacterium]|nr:hypothetical protein [Bacteroidota bacterium]